MPYAIPDTTWFPNGAPAARPFPIYSERSRVDFGLCWLSFFSIRGGELIIVFWGEAITCIVRLVEDGH